MNQDQEHEIREYLEAHAKAGELSFAHDGSPYLRLRGNPVSLDQDDPVADTRRLVTREYHLPQDWQDVVGEASTVGPNEELKRCRAEHIAPETAAAELAADARKLWAGASDAPDLDWDEWERGAAAVALDELKALITDGRFQLLQHKSSGELFALDIGCNRICGPLEQREVYDEDDKVIINLCACDFGQADGAGAGPGPGPYTPESDDELYDLIADQY